MKNLLFTGLFLFLITFTASTQSNSEANAYLGEINDLVEEPKNEIWRYLKAITKEKGARKVETRRQRLIAELGYVFNTVNDKEPFDANGVLKNATLDYLSVARTILIEDYDAILDMEEISDQSYDQMEAYIMAKEKASDKMDQTYHTWIEKFREFASSYGIKLNEDTELDKMSQKIEDASSMLKYYDQVYLIFFKAYFQEGDFLSVMGQNDMPKMKESNDRLAVVAQEGLDKLENIKSYNGDGNLKVAATKMLKFYLEEAEEYFPAMMDMNVKQENMEAAKSKMDSIAKKDRTQADVDAYNKAIHEYNQAITDSNEASEESNSKRTRYLEEWNSKVGKFFESH